MIGIIVVGHNQFSRGLTSSLEMIAGEQKHYVALEFLADAPLEKLTDDINDAILSLKKECEGVLIFTDLFGGTPFNNAFMIALKHENVFVMTGTNLGMLIEAALSRDSAEGLEEFAMHLEEAGKSSAQYVSKSSLMSSDEETDGEGI